MLNSLLNATNVSVDSLILDIFIILAVVVAGALIVYFIWEAVSSFVNKDKKENAAPKFEQKTSKNKDEVLVVDYKLDQEPVKEEVEEPVLLDENNVTDVDQVKAEEEKAEAEQQISDEERANAERRAYLEARRQELIKRMQAEMQENEEEETEETSEVEEEVEPVEEETTEVETLEETAEAQEVETEVDNLEEERQALANEKARYETMVKELEAAKLALASQKQEPTVVSTTVIKKGAFTLEELYAKLADAEERLKATEKEFKQCKKEYTPLRRVWTTHERDEKKLRRKEALVAKQKVILYGVNNYADIDEEKAKKLAEDLDLLDGLKLSVQHCEEVMKKNADRYPLLEKMFNVLNARNEEIKNDIAYYQQEIARLEAEQGQSDSEAAE